MARSNDEGGINEKECKMLEIMSRNKKIILTALALLLVTIVLAYSFYHAPSTLVANVNAAEIAPDELLGMKKIVVSTGVDALQRVKQSHTGSIEHVKDVAIVHYMKEGKILTLWATLYPNETVANTETEKMRVGMQNWGGGWASELKKVTIAEKQVYQTSSDGVTHYFWADHECVFYIIPHNLTQDEISLIIDTIPDEDR
ncbi:MAG: hypothetical protein N2V72_03505 [Methanophagales archaeon]|nr:hypothetical protein [Methanophagales archaeon]